jgi:hypothetical protein
MIYPQRRRDAKSPEHFKKAIEIDASELNRVLLHNNLPGLEAIGGKLKPDALTGQCPECHVDLVSVEGGRDRKHLLHYDTCESCGGIFLESEFKDAKDQKQANTEIVSFFRMFGKARAAV